MPMLEPHECFAGTLMDAKPGTLVLPRTKYESHFLVGSYGENIFAVFLEGEHKFHSMNCEDRDNWKGLLIPNVRVSVDLSSVVDPGRTDQRPGMLVRLLDKMSIWSFGANRFSHQMSRIDLVGSLPPCGSEMQAGFLHWQVVLGRGAEQRVLFDVDLRDKKEGG